MNMLALPAPFGKAGNDPANRSGTEKSDFVLDSEDVS